MRTSIDGIDLCALQVFGAVFETTSIAAAARRLRVTQSAICQFVSGLEREHDVVLFHRQVRSVRPSAAGSVLFEQAGPLVAHARKVAHAVSAAAKTGPANEAKE